MPGEPGDDPLRQQGRRHAADRIAGLHDDVGDGGPVTWGEFGGERRGQRHDATEPDAGEEADDREDLRPGCGGAEDHQDAEPRDAGEEGALAAPPGGEGADDQCAEEHADEGRGADVAGLAGGQAPFIAEFGQGGAVDDDVVAVEGDGATADRHDAQRQPFTTGRDGGSHEGSLTSILMSGVVQGVKLCLTGDSMVSLTVILGTYTSLSPGVWPGLFVVEVRE